MANKSAQQHSEQILAFRDELQSLEEAGVLTLEASQKTAVNRYHQELLAHYREQFDVDTNVAARKLTLGMQAASFFGALALAASVFFLFYQYWANFSLSMQVLVLIAAPVVTLYASHLLYQHEKSGYLARVAAMISFACLVLNLSLLGRIFDLPSSEMALLVWAAYGLMLAYLYRSRLLLAFSIFCFYGFVAARVGVWCGLYWLSFGERPENFFLPALIIFFIPLIPQGRYESFAPIYRVLAICGFMLSVLVLSFWGDGSYLSWGDDVIEGFYQLVGFIGSALLVAIGIKKGWNEVANTGTVFFVFFMYTKMWQWLWDWLPHYVFFLLMGLLAVLFLFIFKRLRGVAQQYKEAV